MNNNLSNTLFFDILAEKVKRDSHEEYNQFVELINGLAFEKNVAELQKAADNLSKFLPHLDMMLSVTNDYEDIMNMKATLLDMMVNDLNDQSIYLLVVALSSKQSMEHLQSFISPISHWVSVIKAKERLQVA